jgi:hypothetical protein
MNPIRLEDHAAGQLRYIRDTMREAKPVTVVPGWGGVLIGGIAVAAAILAQGQPPETWLRYWLAAAAISTAIGLWSMHQKSAAAGSTIRNSVSRKFWLSLIPPLAVGLVMTVALWNRGWRDLLPSLWLLSYGAGVMAAGSFSVAMVPVLGGCFVAAGVLAAVFPQWGNELLGLGFGGLHVVFGWWIARRYDG